MQAARAGTGLEGFIIVRLVRCRRGIRALVASAALQLIGEHRTMAARAVIRSPPRTFARKVGASTPCDSANHANFAIAAIWWSRVSVVVSVALGAHDAI